MFGRKCEICAAKDQTIALLADVVDYMRMAEARGFQAPPPPPRESREPRPEWKDPIHLPEAPVEEPDIDDLMAALNAGAPNEETAERLLSAFQAMNTHVTRAE